MMRALLDVMRALLVVTRALLVVMRALLVVTRALLVVMRALLVVMRALLVVTRALLPVKRKVKSMMFEHRASRKGKILCIVFITCAMRWLILVFVLFVALQGAGQDKWQKGYIITLDNDTINGEVRYRQKPNYRTMYFKNDSNEYEVFNALEIKGYKVGSEVYETHFLLYPIKLNIGNYVFMQKIITGQVWLYKTKDEYISTTYVLKSNNDFTPVYKSKYKKILSEYFEDNPELSKKIDNGIFSYQDVEKVVSTYNNWYNKQ